METAAAQRGGTPRSDTHGARQTRLERALVVLCRTTTSVQSIRGRVAVLSHTGKHGRAISCGCETTERSQPCRPRALASQLWTGMAQPQYKSMHVCPRSTVIPCSAPTTRLSAAAIALALHLLSPPPQQPKNLGTNANRRSHRRAGVCSCEGYDGRDEHCGVRGLRGVRKQRPQLRAGFRQHHAE